MNILELNRSYQNPEAIDFIEPDSSRISAELNYLLGSLAAAIGNNVRSLPALLIDI
jgi:hypothetical protein